MNDADAVALNDDVLNTFPQLAGSSATDARQHTGAQRGQEVVCMSPKSIFIIDDHPVNLELVKVLLVLEGYEVHTASSAESALSMLADLRPDLILMDVQLPGMDGLELARRIKARADQKTVCIIALTAYAMKGDEEKAMAAGCDGYLSKPIDTRTFPGTVARYLEGSPDWH